MENIKGFQINLIESDEKMKEFVNYLEKFNEKFVSIDLEYTNNNARLWQICFFNKNNDNTVYVLQSKIISEKNMEIIKNKLLLSKIIKIFHGGESLDFPYMFSLLKNPEDIYKFLKTTFDTRFLCEYYKIVNNVNKLCNIYDAMLYFGAIPQNKYDELQKINKKMGPIWKVNWDKIGQNLNLLIYTIYDVVYLKKLLLKLYKKYKNDNILEDFFSLQKINNYVLLKRNKIEYDYKLKIDSSKFKVIDYYRSIL
jgi:hypothetical protein